jgi:hypothetical protein
MEGFAGETSTPVRIGAVTVNAVLPVIDPRTAVMVAVPELAPVALPAAVTFATVEFELDHVTEFVMFAVLPSV